MLIPYMQGSFAFSAGLESFLAHVVRQSASLNVTRFRHFLRLSIESLASLTLPYVSRAWSTPLQLPHLLNDLEASTTCSVNKRASIAQGRALLTMWQRSLKPHVSAKSMLQGHANSALHAVTTSLADADIGEGSKGAADDWDPTPEAHFAPLFGALGALMDISQRQTLYLYLLNHAKMVLSAAIRASVLGPYQSQAVLASEPLQSLMARLTDRQLKTAAGPAEAGQTVPAMDIWSGRHELVYSRIFNS